MTRTLHNHKNVHVSNDEDMVQSERNSHFEKPELEKTKLTSRYYCKEKKSKAE